MLCVAVRMQGGTCVWPVAMTFSHMDLISLRSFSWYTDLYGTAQHWIQHHPPLFSFFFSRGLNESLSKRQKHTGYFSVISGWEKLFIWSQAELLSNFFMFGYFDLIQNAKISFWLYFAMLKCGLFFWRSRNFSINLSLIMWTNCFHNFFMWTNWSSEATWA